MKHIFLAALMSALAVGSAMAQGTCESRAVAKDGAPLAGAAKASFLKKCKADTCKVEAVDKNGKPLAGAAKASFLKKCQGEA